MNTANEGNKKDNTEERINTAENKQSAKMNPPGPYLLLTVNKKVQTAFLDSGANCSLISEELLDKVYPGRRPRIYPHNGKVFAASGNKIPIIGTISARISTSAGRITTTFLVYRKPQQVSHDLLLGLNVLRYCTMDFPRRQVEFNRIPRSREGPKSKYQQLQLKIPNGFINYEEETATSAVNASEDHDGTATTSNQQETTMEAKGTEDDDFPIFLTNTITIPKNSVLITPVSINKNLKNNQTIVVNKTELTDTLILPHMCTTISNNNVMHVNLMNLGDTNVILKPGTKLCTATYLNNTPSKSVNAVQSNEDVQSLNVTNDNLRPLTPEDVNCDNPNVKDELINLLNSYRNACWLKDEPLGIYKGDELEIKLKQNVVINKTPYPIPVAYHTKLDKEIDSMLKDGIIKRSKSNFNSPLLIVRKPDGSIRPCLDLRALNEVIEPVLFPLPKISDLLNSLGQSSYFTTLDLASAFHQCKVKEEDQEKLAFTYRNTKYQYARVPFGLSSSPSFFARVINDTLYDILGDSCLAYLDDLVLFNTNKEQHLQTIKQVLERLSNAGIKLKINKCKFFANEIKFLGYKIDKNGMSMNQDRIEAINKMPLPTNKKQLQAFLGVCNYFRIFVPHFAHIADPLYLLLRKATKFKWTELQTQAVSQLKSKLTQAPILKFPDFNKEFILHTDASNAGVGAVLMQKYDDKLHPIAFISKTLNQAQRNYCATKKEALALVYALEHFRQLILTFKVRVFTDHLPLLGALKKPTRDECLQRWALLIQEYNIELNYLKGSENMFADVLSRLSSGEAENLDELFTKNLDERNVLHLNEYIPEKSPFSEIELRNAQLSDPVCSEITNQLTNTNTNTNSNQKQCSVPPEFLLDCKVINGTLYVLRKIKRGTFYDRFLVPFLPTKLFNKALKLLHEDVTAGHSGTERTLKLFLKNYYHNNEKKLVKQYCDNCELCIKAKGNPKKVPLAKFPIPLKPFQCIGSDILGPLRVTEQGNQYVLTIRDYTTRYTLLYPLVRKDTDSIIKALKLTFANYGSSNVLITDNAPEYTSEKLIKFLNNYNTKKVEIAPYHPSSAGLSERINREVNKLLRIYLDEYARDDWDSLLPVIQLTINNTYNHSIRESPFFALFGYDSATVALTPPKLNYSEDELDQHMQRVAQIRQHCHSELLKSTAAYTDYNNINRKDKLITVGQRVYAKLDKHNPHKRKLDLPVSGPYTVINKKGRAWILKEIHSSSGKTHVVHPDFIIIRDTSPVETSCEPTTASVEQETTSNRRVQPERRCKQPR